MKSLAERFWAKVDRRGADECWPWRGAVGNSMTPILWIPPRTTRSARRVSLDLAGRPAGRRQFVRPEVCGRDLCVNPGHLVPGRPPRPPWW